MTMKTGMQLLALVGAAGLSSCATTGSSGHDSASLCRPKAAATLVGQAAPADAILLRTTHSTVIRRLAPGDAMTKDLRAERLTVTVADGRVVSAFCG